MKPLSTLIFILIGAMALANNEINVKVDAIKMGVVLDLGMDSFKDTPEIKNCTTNGITRLYRVPNSRVKKALTFTTEFHRPKLT
ncbi:hypothetical protein [Pareuzebyella sediminis]|uniref:hypothetical protein n=1 Tax=Pareuzebyella sediminis TaxID=2607998 RepID=UPI0011ED0514|nr:hypothetical protein [Pareuzebyella sediminis]